MLGVSLTEVRKVSPSRKGCAVNGEITMQETQQMSTPPPPLEITYLYARYICLHYFYVYRAITKNRYTWSRVAQKQV